MQVVKDIFKFLVFSNYWISFAAAAFAFLTVEELNLTVPFSFYWFVFAGTLCSYCLQRYLQLSDRKSSQSERQNWLVGNRLYLGLTVIASGVVCLILGATLLTINQIIWLIPVGLISLLYSFKFLKGRGKEKKKKSSKIGLRDIPGLKIFMIGISWAFLCGLLPMWIHGLTEFTVSDIIFVSLEKLLFIIAITIPFDVRDLKHDHKSKRTIPQVLGINRSLNLSVFLLALGAITFIFAPYGAQIITGLAISYGFTMVVILSVKKDTPELYYSGLIDGAIIVQLGLVVLTSIIL